MVKKKPQRTAKNRRKNKSPANKPIIDIGKEYFQWRTKKADLEGPWGWKDIDIKYLFMEIIPKLNNFETMRWGEVEKNKSHFVTLSDCCKEAKTRLQELHLDDIEALFSLRMSGKERILGIVEGAIFMLLWWDPHHEVCPSPPKHT